jgi:hypothetical protein
VRSGEAAEQGKRRPGTNHGNGKQDHGGGVDNQREERDEDEDRVMNEPYFSNIKRDTNTPGIASRTTTTPTLRSNSPASLLLLP